MEATSSKIKLSYEEESDTKTPREPITAHEEINENPLDNLQVSSLEKDLPLLVKYFNIRADCFQAGQLTHKLCELGKITSDSEVLQAVCGEEIEFMHLPHQVKAPKENKFSKAEQLVVEQKIKKLSSKGVIVKSTHEPDEFISPIFQDQSLMAHTG